MEPQYSLEYICTHLGEEGSENKYAGAVTPPVFATSLHTFDDIEGLLGFNAETQKGSYIYGRVDNPTITLLEKKLAAIEKAQGAVCFASGMAAITSAMNYSLKPGDHMISVKNAYGPACTYIEQHLQEIGVTHTYVSGKDPKDFEEALQPNTKFIYLESPTSLVFELQDLQAVAKLAKDHGIITAIDNTYCAGVYQHPLELGIDIVVHTISKYFGGHSDVIGGVLCANQEIVDAVHANQRELYGGILGPFEGWLVLRSLRTLSLRLEKSSANALAVAKMLEAHPLVRKVNHPMLASYDQTELAKKQMKGACGLFSFELDASVEDTMKFVNALHSFQKGVSWGGFESLVCMPMYKSSEEEAQERGASRNLIRIYCGLENTDDLLRDIEHALLA